MLTATITYVWANVPNDTPKIKIVREDETPHFYALVTGTIGGLCLAGAAVTSVNTSDI